MGDDFDAHRALAHYPLLRSPRHPLLMRAGAAECSENRMGLMADRMTLERWTAIRV